MKLHTAAGEALVIESTVLAPIGPIVRGHHERVDGNGYPDGLADDAIPLAARIVSVCDAYDAMAHTRQYRVGMGNDRAVAVLREHAGSQWDPLVVDALVVVLSRDDGVSNALDDVGRTAPDGEVARFCGCEDALPAELTTLSGSVRALVLI